MNGEFGEDVKEYSPGLSVFGGTDENHDEPQDNLCSGSEFSQSPTEYKSEMLWFEPVCLVSMVSQTLGRENFSDGLHSQTQNLNKNFKAIHNFAECGNSLEQACHVRYYVYSYS
jgi:hypothetical protein